MGLDERPEGQTKNRDYGVMSDDPLSAALAYARMGMAVRHVTLFKPIGSAEATAWLFPGGEATAHGSTTNEETIQRQWEGMNPAGVEVFFKRDTPHVTVTLNNTDYGLLLDDQLRVHTAPSWVHIDETGRRVHHFKWPGLLDTVDQDGPLYQDENLTIETVKSFVAPPTIAPNGTRLRWIPGYSPADRRLRKAPDMIVDLVEPHRQQPE